MEPSSQRISILKYAALSLPSSTYYGTSCHSLRKLSQSPFLHAFYSHHPLRLTIDTGAETNMMRASLAWHIGAKVTKSSQTALQADGRTPLAVVGETCLPLIHHGRPLTLEALVDGDLDRDFKMSGRQTSRTAGRK